jgi:hypothetical protein
MDKTHKHNGPNKGPIKNKRKNNARCIAQERAESENEENDASKERRFGVARRWARICKP